VCQSGSPFPADNTGRQSSPTKLRIRSCLTVSPPSHRISCRRVIVRLLQPHIGRRYAAHGARRKTSDCCAGIHTKVADNRRGPGITHRRPTEHPKATRRAKIDHRGIRLKRKTGDPTSGQINSVFNLIEYPVIKGLAPVSGSSSRELPDQLKLKPAA